MLPLEDLELPAIGREIDGGCAIMQYTGLKDKNGREIYEGDIVRTTRYYDEKDWIVDFGEYDDSDTVWGSPGIGWFLHRPERDESLIFFDQEFREVVGNIYENPELLS